MFVPSSALTIAAVVVFGLAVGTVTGLARVDGLGAAVVVPDLPLPGTRPGDVQARRRPSVRGHRSRDFPERCTAPIVALLRLSPAVPFGLQNYLYGLTGIGFGTYLLTSWIAMLPGTVMYAYLGYLGRAGLDAAGAAGRPRTPLEWALLAVGLAATVAVTLVVTGLARRALREPGGSPRRSRTPVIFTCRTDCPSRIPPDRYALPQDGFRASQCASWRSKR